MDVESFKAAALGLGMNSPARFIMHIPRLGILLNSLCCSVEVVNPSFNTFSYKQPQPTLRLPFEFIFEPLQMQFYVTDYNEPVRTLQNWQKEIYTDDFRFNDFDSYTEKVVTVIRLSHQDIPIGVYQYYNCYPLYVGPTTQSFDSRNVVNKVPLSLAYEYSKCIF